MTCRCGRQDHIDYRITYVGCETWKAISVIRFSFSPAWTDDEGNQKEEYTHYESYHPHALRP